MNSFFPQFQAPNSNTNTTNQNNETIPLELINQLQYFIALIEHKNKYSTCFFINLDTTNTKNPNAYYLCTTSAIITEQDIESKKTFKIFLGDKYLDTISIKLDKEQRKIKQFHKANQIILIQIIPEIDNISDDKFLKLYDNDYSPYIGENAKDVYICGFKNFFTKESSVINCKIIKLKDNYKITLDSDEKNFSSCSPICIINTNDDSIFQIIGFQVEYNILQDSHGYLFGPIINSLEDFTYSPEEQDNIDNDGFEGNEIDDEGTDGIINTNNNISTNFNNEEMKKLQQNYFYTFQEYKQQVIKFHNLISKYYVAQNPTNFLNRYSILKDYLKKYPYFTIKYKQFLEDLQYFNDTKNFKNPIKHEVIKNMNTILSSGNLELIQHFAYFIAGTMLAIYSYGTQAECLFVNNGDRLYKRVNLNYEDIVRFEKNINNIILFKTFLNEMTTLEHLHGQLYRTKIDTSFQKKLNKFDTQIFINHNFLNENWKASCISLSTFLFPEKVINLFTFFEVQKVDVNYEEKTAKITLGNVGRIKILEEQIAEKNNIFKLEYNNFDNLMEVL